MSLLDECLADSPAGLWMMDTTEDYSANTNTLTFNGTTLVDSIIPSVASQARSFNGSSDRATAADHATLDLGDVFTAEAWVKLDVLPGAFAVANIFDKGSGGMQVDFHTDASTCRWNLSRQDTVGIVESTVSPVTSVVYHHAVTKNGATVNQYVNGVDVTGTVTNSTVPSTAFSLFIGCSYALNQFLDGTMQGLALYPTALSQARVIAHYNAGIAAAGGTPTPFPPRARMIGRR